MNRILIPLDGSPLAEQAVELGRTLAQRARATILLVHVRNRYHPIYVEGLPVIDERLRPVQGLHEWSYLKGVRARLQAGTALEVEMALLDGPIAPTLAAEARDTGSDLIIMTTHGYGGFERFWLGSVADALLRISEVPLLLHSARGTPEGTVEPFRCDSILVPLDGSALAEEVLGPMERLAQLVGARVHLLRVLSHEEAAAPPGAMGVSPRARAEGYLQSVADTLGAGGIEVEWHLATHEHPARAILTFAEQLQGTLIAMATQGEGGMRRFLLGSVSDKVLRGSSSPLLLYRPRGDSPAAVGSERLHASAAPPPP